MEFDLDWLRIRAEMRIFGKQESVGRTTGFSHTVRNIIITIILVWN